MFKRGAHEPLYNGAPALSPDESARLAVASAAVKRAAIDNDAALFDSAVKHAMAGFAPDVLDEARVILGEVVSAVDSEFKKVAEPLVRALGAAIGSSTLLPLLTNRLGRGQTHRDAFTKMLDRFPHLKGSPTETADAFHILARYAPTLAEDHVGAGHFVTNAVQLGAGAITPAMIKELIQAESAKSGDPAQRVLEVGKLLSGLKLDDDRRI